MSSNVFRYCFMLCLWNGRPCWMTYGNRMALVTETRIFSYKPGLKIKASCMHGFIATYDFWDAPPNHPCRKRNKAIGFPPVSVWVCTKIGVPKSPMVFNMCSSLYCHFGVSRPILRPTHFFEGKLMTIIKGWRVEGTGGYRSDLRYFNLEKRRLQNPGMKQLLHNTPCFYWSDWYFQYSAPQSFTRIAVNSIIANEGSPSLTSFNSMI